MAANDVENTPESAIGVHNDDGDEVVGENAELLNNQIKIESAILYEMEALHCHICLSLPVPPVYHCSRGHLLCSNCRDKDTKQCNIENCKRNMTLCKLTTFLLSRMEIFCPNKSHGCSISLPIKNFDSHVEECTVFHPQYNSSSSCPCCGAEYADLATLMYHFESQHEPTEVLLGEDNTLMMALGQKRILKVKSSQIYLLLKFEEEALSLHHMFWDEPRRHGIQVKDLGCAWEFIGRQTVETRSDSVEHSLELPRIFHGEVSVRLRIGSSRAKAMAVLNLADLAGHANLPDDADVKLLVCLLCDKATAPLFHCRFHHTICLICCDKVKLEGKPDKVEEPDKAKGKTVKIDKVTKCPYCTRTIKRCMFGSYILENSYYYCPNRSVGCEEVMSIVDYETHIDNCLEPYCCPICARGFDDVLKLLNHFANHESTRVHYMELQHFMVCRGRELIVEESTNDVFLLMFEENELCLQHMWWGETRKYIIEFKDLRSTWSFRGKTTAMERFPKPSSICLKIPEKVLHPDSSQPVMISLKIKQRVIL